MPVRTDGSVLSRTQRNLERGFRGSAISREAIEVVTGQAVGLITKIIDAYEEDVAQGEVGAEGSGSTGDAEPIRRCPTGLLYGRVQSGKTAAMILASALALDNGFRVIVVVTADNVALVRQTADRFRAIDGPRVLSTVKEGGNYVWEGDEEDLQQNLGEEGVVLVCAKDAWHLPSVINLLRRIDAAAYPALIFDDEADAATPDTTLAARATGRPDAPPYESTIYRRVIENTRPDEDGESVREVLVHHAFIGVTATPYLLLLQGPGSQIRPDFAHLLEAGEGYCGGEVFFAAFDPTAGSQQPPLVLVADNEAQALVTRRRIPEGLTQSVLFFLLASAARSELTGQRFPTAGYKHLSHTSPRQLQHENVAEMISRFLATLRRTLRGDEANPAIFDGAYAELRRTVPDPPPLGQLIGVIDASIGQSEVIRVNALTGAPAFGPTFNFLVGGNILARGLTIDDLLVTYYVREARVSQMDTVWQHARMYGYRQPLMPFTRVYLPQRLALLFKNIHESEVALRNLLEHVDPGTVVPIQIAPRTRATRPNAIDPGGVRVYGADLQQVFPYYFVDDPAQVGGSARQIAQIARDARVPLDEPERERRFVDVTIETATQIIATLPISETDDGRWDSDALLALLASNRERFGDRVSVYARRFDPGDTDRRRIHGVLSGEEVTMARGRGTFTLALVYSGTADNPQGWYPTLVLPPNMPPHVFNSM